jgi:hypothetical protein
MVTNPDIFNTPNGERKQRTVVASVVGGGGELRIRN